MVALQIVLFVVMLIPTFFLWAALHELAHVVMAKILYGVKDAKIYLLPHMYEGHLRFASASCTPITTPTDQQAAAVYLAPRIPDIVGAALFPLAFMLPVQAWPFCLPLCGGSLIDLWVGSWGSNETTDLVKASRRLNCSPWMLRIAGWTIIALSISVAVAIAIGG